MRTIFKAIAFLALAISVAPARAQFNGYFSPQTVTKKVFTAQSTPLRVIVPNQGQVVHQIVYKTTSSSCSLEIQMEGSIDGVNFFAISPVGSVNNVVAGQTNGVGIISYGQFPVLAVDLTAFAGCPGGSVDATYTGTSTSIPNPNGTFQQSNGWRQTIVQNVNLSGGAAIVATIPTPFNNASGTIYLQCNGTPCGPGTNLVSIFPVLNPPLSGSVTITTFNAANSTALQTFAVPQFSAPYVQFSIQSGAFTTTSLSIYYDFNYPGFSSSGSPTSVNLASVGGTPVTSPLPVQLFGTSSSGGNPIPVCDKRAIVTGISTATTTLAITGVASQKVRICSAVFSNTAGTGNNATYKLVEGTGAACGTGTADLTNTSFLGDTTLSDSSIIWPFSGLSPLTNTTAGNNICITTTAVTGTPAVSVMILYAQY